MRCDNIGASNVPEFTLRAITLILDNLEVPIPKEKKLGKGNLGPSMRRTSRRETVLLY